MSNGFAAVINRFYCRIREIQPETWVVPPQPVLHLHCGPADVETIRQVRTSVGSDVILLYLFWGRCEVESELARNSEDLSSRLLLAAAGPEAFPVDLVSMSVTLLQYSAIYLSVTPGMDAQFAAMLSAIDVAIATAGQNRAVSRAGRISNLEALSGNLFLMRYHCRQTLVPGKKTFPAVVCGAGPSLAGQLDLLRRQRDRYFLICVGHAFKTLMDAGIVPDLVAEIDPNCRANWNHDIKPGTIPLAAGIFVDPAVAERFQNLLWCSASAFDESLNVWVRSAGIDLLNPAYGRSVFITAVDLARIAGFEHIALIGSDLCYSQSGQSHAGSGTCGRRPELIPAQGNEGNTVYSDENFLGIKANLEQYLARNGNSANHICNCTVGGVGIKNTYRMTLEDFLNRFGAPTTTIISESSCLLSTERLTATLNALDDYVRISELLVEVADSAMTAPDQAETIAGQLLGAEQGLAGDDVAAAWIANIRHQTDDLLLGPLLPVDRSSNPGAVWGQLAMRYRIVSRLTRAVREKLCQANVATTNASAFLASIYEQSVFSWLASLSVRGSDPQLADYLTGSATDYGCRDFYFMCKWQNVEKIDWFAPDGSRLTLDPPAHWDKVVAEETQTALTSLELQPDDGIVFLAPCGWQYVFELVKQQPKRQLLVVEPLPALMRLVTRSALLLHMLPASTAIIGADDALLPGWEERLRRCLVRWREKEIRPRLLVHPQAIAIPAVKQAAGRLATML